MPIWSGGSDSSSQYEQGSDAVSDDEDSDDGLIDPDEVSSQPPSDDPPMTEPPEDDEPDVPTRVRDGPQTPPPEDTRQTDPPEGGADTDLDLDGGGGGSSGGGGGGSSGSGGGGDSGGGTDDRDTQDDSADTDDRDTSRSERSEPEMPGQPRQQDGQQSVQDIQREFPSRSLQLAALQTQRQISQEQAEQILDEAPEPEPRQPTGPQEGLESGGTVEGPGGTLYEAFYNVDGGEVDAPDTAQERLQFTQEEGREVLSALDQQQDQLEALREQGRISDEEYEDRLADIEEQRGQVSGNIQDIEEFEADIEDRAGSLTVEDGTLTFTPERDGGEQQQRGDRAEPSARERISAGSTVDVSDDEDFIAQAIDVGEELGQNFVEEISQNVANIGTLLASPAAAGSAFLPDTSRELRDLGEDVLNLGTETMLAGQEVGASTENFLEENDVSGQFVAEQTSAVPVGPVESAITGAELAERSTGFINEAVEAAGGPAVLPKSDTLTEDAVTGLTSGAATAGTQAAGFFGAGIGGLGVMAADAAEDPVGTGEDFVRSVPEFTGLLAAEAADDPLRFATEEVGEEVSEAALGALVLGPAGAALGAVPTVEVEPEPEPQPSPDESGGFPADQTLIRIDEEGNVFRNMRTEPVGQFQGVTGRMAQARATRSTMRLRGMDADQAAADAASVDVDDVDPDTTEDIDATESLDDTLLDSVLDDTEPEPESDEDAAQDIVEEGLDEGRDLDEINEDLEDELGVRAQETEQGQIQFVEVEEEQEPELPEGFEIQEEVEIEELEPEQESESELEVEEQEAVEIQELDQELELEQETMQVEEEAQVDAAVVEEELVQEQDEMLEPDLQIEPQVDQEVEPEPGQEQIPEPVLDITPEQEAPPDREITPGPLIPELEIEPGPEEPGPDRPPEFPEFDFEDDPEPSTVEEELEREAGETEFAPSLEAVVFDIRGEELDPDELTGLELRPLREEDV